MRRWVWVFVALSALMLAVSVAFWSGERSAIKSPALAVAQPVTPRGDSTPRPPEPTRAELALLQAQVAGLRDQMLEAERTRQGVAALAEAPAPPPSPAPLEGPEIRVRYDKIFDQEVADLNWSRAERQTLAGFFAGDPEGLRVEALECKRSMCRARLGFENRTARDRFLAKVGTPPLDKGSFWNSNPEGTSVALFTAREGQPMPDVSQE
jgi:uncharacterized protein (DUF2236 family)